MSKSGARVLVVDDEIEIVRALQRSLAAHGYEVFAASSGEEALEAMVHHRSTSVGNLIQDVGHELLVLQQGLGRIGVDGAAQVFDCPPQHRGTGQAPGLGQLPGLDDAIDVVQVAFGQINSPRMQLLRDRDKFERIVQRIDGIRTGHAAGEDAQRQAWPTRADATQNLQLGRQQTLADGGPQ